MHKFETSIAFPLLKINTLVTYTEVEKPSGISYFLLVLLNEYSDKSVKISHLLKQFGVPSDLNELFADEIKKLLDLDIIKSDYGYVSSYFEEYQLSAFRFTPKGKKVFIEEAIPTNINKEKKQIVYYNPATKQLTLEVDREYGSSESSVLGEDFFKQFNAPEIDLIEEYFNSKKSNGLPIKLEEIILSTKILNVEYNYITYPLAIQIEDTDLIQFDFEDSKIKSFFEQYYTADMISDLLMVKNKFKFSNGETIKTQLSKLAPYEKIYLPDSTKLKLNDKSMIDIHIDLYPTSNAKLTYSSFNIMSALNMNAAFLKVYDMNKAYVYIPARISANTTNLENLILKLLIEKKLDHLQLDTVLSSLFELYKTFEDDDSHVYCYKNLLLLAKLTNNFTLVHKKIDMWISELLIEEKVLMLGRIKDKSVNEPSVYDYIKKTGLTLLDNYIKDINEDNLETKIASMSWITKANKLSNIQVLERIISNVKDIDKKASKVYDTLESLGYSSIDLLTLLKDYVMDILGNGKSNSHLVMTKNTLDNALENLQELTGITDPTNYAINDSIDKTKFVNLYKVYQESLQSLSFLDQFDKTLLKQHLDFNRIFSKLYELYTSELYALGNPRAINEKMIETKINSGDTLSVVTYLYVKLTFLCKSKFNLDNEMVNMIQKLEKDNIINADEGKILHSFRQYRNDLEHVNDIKKSLDKKELIEVKKIIFKLEVMKI